MYNKFSSIPVLLLLCLIKCSPVPYGFTVDLLHSQDRFSGKALNGRTIGIGPLLTGKSVDSTTLLTSPEHFKLLQKLRTDLKLVPAQDILNRFIKQQGIDSLKFFLDNLFNQNILTMQTRDSLWSALASDYYMVMRMVRASNVKTFNRSTRKRLHLEAELWKCNSMEVVWRVSVHGICVSGEIPDSRFVMEAVKKAYLKLPATLSSYGDEKW
jgi:hypothetical protein